MYEYLFAVLLAGVIWSILLIRRKDLRKIMLSGGLLYVIILSLGFIAYKLVVNDVSRTINPGYWSPRTLFDLAHKTGGYGIEDLLFMLFEGGLASVAYKLYQPRHLTRRAGKLTPSKGCVLLFGVLAAGLVCVFTPLNAIYALVTFSFFGWLTVICQRSDLFRLSLMGGIVFLAMYVAQFLLFSVLFPDFVGQNYNLQHTSHVILLNIPLEEYLYGLTFGLFWSTIYDYLYTSTT